MIPALPHARRAALAAVLLLAPALLAPPAPAAPARTGAAVVHPTPEDIAALPNPSGLALSPDGRQVAYALATQTFDPAARPSDGDTKGGWTRAQQIVIAPVAGGGPRAMTSGADHAREPRWSPDGRTLAFLRPHGGRTRLELLPLDGGEARVLDTGALEPSDYRWSPDGRSIAFTAEVPETPAEKEAKWRDGGVETWGETFRPRVLWVIPVAGGEPRQVSSGPGNVVRFEWSPDGTRFALFVSRTADPYEVFNRLVIRVVSARDGALVREWGADPRAFDALAWSPDGTRLAVLTVRESLSMLDTIELLDVANGRVSDLPPSLDTSFTALAWSPDGRSLVAATLARTATPLVRVDAASGAMADLGLPATCVIGGGIALGPDGRHAAFLASTDRTPTSPWAFDLDARAARPIVDSAPLVSGWTFGPQSAVRWANAEGDSIEGLYTRPARLAPGARPPLIVFPHGGPDAVTSAGFSAQTVYFAAHGYAVLRPNYRGGLGYGHAFYAANRGRFGEIETADIESGVDALIARGLADPARLNFGGWSWGGYITAWTLTHQTRYRACVVGAGVSDVTLQYSVSDINHGVAAEWEYKGDPWRELDHFDRANPIRFARNARTPTLILHGEADTRVGFQASVELYRALSDIGCPVKFYAYPRENHGFVEPAHIAQRLRVWLDWYDSHAPGARPLAAR